MGDVINPKIYNAVARSVRYEVLIHRKSDAIDASSSHIIDWKVSSF